MIAPPRVGAITNAPDADVGATRLLRVLACATLALAPLEGYLTAVHGQLAKLPAALLVVAWVVVRVRHRTPPRPHPIHLVFAMFTMLLLASAVVHSGEPFTLEYTLRWLPFLGITVILIDVCAREVPIRVLLTATIGGAVVAGIWALYGFVSAGHARASGPMEDPNDLAYVLAVALPLLVAKLPGHQEPGRGARTPLVVLAAVILVAGVASTFSRGGALALAAAVGWLTLRRVLSLRVLAGGLVGLTVAGAALLLAGPDLARSFQEKSYIADSNVDARELRWQAAARMLAENPVLGVGPGGFRSEYVAASDNAEIAEQTPVAHNMFLEVAAELGLPAFVLFIGLLGTALVISEQVRRSSLDPRPMTAVQAGLIAASVASIFLSEQYYLPLWSLVAFAVAADLRARRMRGTSDAGAPCDQ